MASFCLLKDGAALVPIQQSERKQAVAARLQRDLPLPIKWTLTVKIADATPHCLAKALARRFVCRIRLCKRLRVAADCD
jgi:hypothetical protein